MEEATNSVTVITEAPSEPTVPVHEQSSAEAVAAAAEVHSQVMEPVSNDNRLEQPMESISGDLDGAFSNMYIHIKALNSKQIASKWLKTSVLRQDPRVARHIPDTRIYSIGALSSMLSAYGKVVLKPVVGTGGLGLIMITRVGGHYLVRHRQSMRRYVSFGALTGAVKRMRRRRRYLIQRGITLATIDGRPIDYRVKMVRKRKSWSTTAMVGRLARHGLFVTNLCRGGTLLTAAEGIRRSLSPVAVRSKKTEMRQLTRLCLMLLERAFPGVGEFGFDYGIDQSGMIWIFEVNTRPH